LGMVLYGEGRLALHREALDGAVVQVQVGDLGAVLQRIDVHGEAVVLGRDLDLAGGEILDGLVSAVMAELELVGLPAEGQAEDLMAQADAEDGDVSEEARDLLARAGD